MPQTRQHIEGEGPPRQRRLTEGVVMTGEDMQRFLADFAKMNRSEETAEAVQEGKIVCDQNEYKQIVTVSSCLQKELLNYAQKNGTGSGPIFQTRDDRSVHRTYMSAAIQNPCEEAKVPREKENPKSLRKLYLSAKAGIESNISLPMEQAVERMMEQEQFTIGWYK